MPMERAPLTRSKSRATTSAKVSRGLVNRLSIGGAVLFTVASLLVYILTADTQQKSSTTFDVRQVLRRPWVQERPVDRVAVNQLLPLDSEGRGGERVPTLVEVESRQLGDSDSAHVWSKQADSILDSPPFHTEMLTYASHSNKGTVPKRVALLVYGLQRSLSLTVPSIHKSVFQPLLDIGYEPTVFLHQFDEVERNEHFGATDVTSQEGEEHIAVDRDWWSLLGPFRYIKTSQKNFLQSHREQLNECAKHGTSSEAKQVGAINSLASQLKSVEEVSKLWEAHYVTNPQEYAAVAYIRPDVQYQALFPVHMIPELQDSTVYVPSWANNMNDSFAMMHPTTVRIWKGRLAHTLEHCLEESIHSGTFVKHFVASKRLQLVKLPVDLVDGSVDAAALPSNNDARHSMDSGFFKSPSKHTSPLLNYSGKPPASKHHEPKENDGTTATRKPQREVSPKSQGWDNSIAVCAIMKQEQVSDVREWLMYHKWIGVDKIYLRENKNTTALSKHFHETFQDLTDEGFLDLATWSGQSPQAQQLWYNRCAKADLAGAQSWILFSDLDEYPVITEGGVAVEEPDLKAFMHKHRGAAGLTLQWVMFGSGGLRERPQPGGPLRHFDKCSGELSFQMKCLAASHYLADIPFIHPYFIHSCCYNYKEGADPKRGPSVFYGDGKRKHNMLAKRMMYHKERSKKADKFGLVPTKNAPKCRTYEGHLQPHEFDASKKQIPQGEALVLFHYVSRSFQDFRERKLSRYAGVYVNDFKERRAKATAKGGPVPTDEELLDALEQDLGVNKEAAVCSSAVDAHYASQCCERSH